MASSAFINLRATLTPQHRGILDTLAVRLATVNRGRPLARPVETWSRQIQQAAPTLTKEECDALAAYALHAVVSDGSPVAANQSKQGPPTSFNLQYLQLQRAMQNEAQLFAVVSMIMKTKHGVAQNIINHIQ
jgi:hypothetical protein